MPFMFYVTLVDCAARRVADDANAVHKAHLALPTYNTSLVIIRVATAYGTAAIRQLGYHTNQHYGCCYKRLVYSYIR